MNVKRDAADLNTLLLCRADRICITPLWLLRRCIDTASLIHQPSMHRGLHVCKKGSHVCISGLQAAEEQWAA